MAKKRQTFGKIQRERERAEKRARKLEKKEERKAAAAAGLPDPYAVVYEDDEEAAAELETPAEELQDVPQRAPDTAG